MDNNTLLLNNPIQSNDFVELHHGNTHIRVYWRNGKAVECNDLPAKVNEFTTRFGAISDTHGYHRSINLPKGDILIHAGDLTRQGKLYEIEDVIHWFKVLLSDNKYKDIIWIAGNHDFAYQDKPQEVYKLFKDIPHLHYLEHYSKTIQEIIFYGIPSTPWFYDWAFNIHRNTIEMRTIWNDMNPDTDILISHGPPKSFLDITKEGDSVGCKTMLETLLIKKPKIVICGHIHEGYGRAVLPTGTKIYNVAICTRNYKPTNKPTVIDYEET